MTSGKKNKQTHKLSVMLKASSKASQQYAENESICVFIKHKYSYKLQLNLNNQQKKLSQ